MVEEEVTSISVGEFETIPQLLASSESLQLAFIVLIIGLLVLLFGGITGHDVSVMIGVVVVIIACFFGFLLIGGTFVVDREETIYEISNITSIKHSAKWSCFM